MSIQTYETGNSVKAVQSYSAGNGLIVAGFVIAQPASGQFRAVFPEFGLYSDIKVEDIKAFNSANDSIAVPIKIAEETDMDREELKAHLENQDLRVDARLKSFEQTVKDAMGEIRIEISNFGGDLKAVERDLGHLKDLKSSMRNTTMAIVTAIIGSAIAIYFGIQSSNSSLISGTIAGFGVGKDITAAQAAIAQQTKETQTLLQQIQMQQKALQDAMKDSQAKPPALNPKAK